MLTPRNVSESETSLSERWRQDTAIEASLQGSTPAVDDSHLYVGDLSGAFYALSRNDGSVAWRQERAGELSDSSAYYQDGTVYVGSGSGTIYAYDGTDGSERWTQSGPSAVTSSPVVHDDVVFVGRNDGELLALDAADGTVCWQTSLDGAIHSDLSYSQMADAVVASTTSGSVFAFDADSGTKRWSQSFGASVGSSSPVIDDTHGLVYFAANELMAISVGSGTSAWGTSFYGANTGSSPAFDAERVYVGGGDGSVHGVSRPDGMLATAPDWEFQTWDVSIAGDLTVANDQLLVSTLDGGLHVLDTDSGTEQVGIELPCEIRSSPVVADGDIYIAGCDGTVFAFR